MRVQSPKSKVQGRLTAKAGATEADFDLLPQELRLAFLDRVRPAGEKLTLEAVGCVIGITRERVRQIEAGALVKLRKRARQLGLDSSLGDMLARGRRDAKG